MSYINRSQIRQLSKHKFDAGISSAADPVISLALEDIIEKAAKRAKDNGRKIIKARDV